MPSVVIQSFTPLEDVALQAMHSHSTLSLSKRRESLEKRGGPGEFLRRFYLNANHESIGDLGIITLDISGVSLLCAKVIQQHPLYNGIESSTRYLSLDTKAKNGCVHQFKEQENLQDSWLSLYRRALGATNAHDVARGFLPIGTKTTLSWTGSYRSIRDHLTRMMKSYLKEANSLARQIWSLLHGKFPEMFKPIEFANTPDIADFPIHNHLGITYKDYGEVDFGSWRDWQRHRTLSIEFPDLSKVTHANKWYLNELPDNALRLDAEKLFELTLLLSDRNEISSQYVLPLMSSVPIRMSGEDWALRYAATKRGKKEVHPTARDVSRRVLDSLDGDSQDSKSGG